MRKSCLKNFLLIAIFSSLLSFYIYAGPLEDYVNLPDSSYTYTITTTESSFTHTYYVVDLTSQTWRNSSEVNRTLWKHWLTIIVPTSITKTKGLLIISGGNNGSSATNLRDYAQYIALLTGAPVALLEQVPNQPLLFAGESSSRTEDEIIAYSFDKYLQTYNEGNPDPYWPVLLPMVKSAVRAMDTIQEIVLNNHSKTINGFVVGGASKRGWTTWLTGAVDSRVIAIVPIVIDVLKMDIQMDHQYKCYGFFSETLTPYNELHIFERMSTPGGYALRQIVDPYSYLSNYTMPKYIINACGDEFFLPDSSRFYYHELPGECRLKYTPNVGHSMGDSFDLSTVYPLITYFNSVATGGSRPNYSWQFLPDGSIQVQVSTNPTSVKLWEAVNPTARDFRYYDGTGPTWTSTNLSETSPGSKTYLATVTPPTSGWKVYMVEINFSNGSYVFTTDIGITPYMRPYDDLDGDGWMDPEDTDDDCDLIPDENDLYPWDTDNDGTPNYLDDTPGICLVEVPYVVGLPEAEATTDILGTGLFVGNITYICDNTFPAGVVVNQEPTAGTEVEPGTSVDLWISTGPCPPEGEGTAEGIIEGEGVVEGTPEGEGIIEGEGVVEG
ncbi:MAG TPA: PhoPQ-activated protein PqaA family protein, partial [Candidatus Hydrogenedens sp.]|nr:PhoPQ-activated protein PqaA family protein [Candidatus Hydrogenedens sp.]